MAKKVILDPTPIEVPVNATFEDLMKMWPKEPDAMAMAKAMREMGDWLAENHKDVVF